MQLSHDTTLRPGKISLFDNHNDISTWHVGFTMEDHDSLIWDLYRRLLCQLPGSRLVLSDWSYTTTDATLMYINKTLHLSCLHTTSNTIQQLGPDYLRLPPYYPVQTLYDFLVSWLTVVSVVIKTNHSSQWTANIDQRKLFDFHLITSTNHDTTAQCSYT